MNRRVVIGGADTTFTAQCETCGATFAGRLDDDLDEGVFLCREGHATTIVRAAQADDDAATAAA